MVFVDGFKEFQSLLQNICCQQIFGYGELNQYAIQDYCELNLKLRVCGGNHSNFDFFVGSIRSSNVNTKVRWSPWKEKVKNDKFPQYKLISSATPTSNFIQLLIKIPLSSFTNPSWLLAYFAFAMAKSRT